MVCGDCVCVCVCVCGVFISEVIGLLGFVVYLCWWVRVSLPVYERVIR